MPQLANLSGLASRACLAGAALFTFGSAPASAALIANLSFTTPSGVVSDTDSIQVWATLSLGAGSDALIVENGNIVSGVSDQDYEDAGIDPSQVSTAFLNTFFLCSGTFTSSCTNGPPYAFTFNLAAPTLTFPQNLNLQAGESADFLFGTFTPTGGVAPPGTYTFYDMGLTVNPRDANGDAFDGPGGFPISMTIARTCPTQTADCAFTRTVLASAVPEPASWAMMIGGFGLVGGALRSSRSRQAAAA